MLSVSVHVFTGSTLTFTFLTSLLQAMKGVDNGAGGKLKCYPLFIY